MAANDESHWFKRLSRVLLANLLAVISALAALASAGAALHSAIGAADSAESTNDALQSVREIAQSLEKVADSGKESAQESKRLTDIADGLKTAAAQSAQASRLSAASASASLSLNRKVVGLDGEPELFVTSIDVDGPEKSLTIYNNGPVSAVNIQVSGGLYDLGGFGMVFGGAGIGADHGDIAIPVLRPYEDQTIDISKLNNIWEDSSRHPHADRVIVLIDIDYRHPIARSKVYQRRGFVRGERNPGPWRVLTIYDLQTDDTLKPLLGLSAFQPNHVQPHLQLIEVKPRE